MQGSIKVFSGSAHLSFSRRVCEHLGLPLGQSKLVRFSNQNMLVQIEDNVREADVFFIQPSCPPVSDGILEMLITIDALKHASAGRITAVIPYFPYSRSDKKDRPRVSITARLMADLIETAGADRVLTLDLHAPQIQGFFRIPVDQLIAAPLLCQRLSRSSLAGHVVVASDIGEAKDIERYANRLDLPVAIIDKRRYADNTKPVAHQLVGDVAGKTALIIDDEIASGGTLLEAASFCLARGARAVKAAAVHGVFSGQALDRIAESPIESLLVTDSLPLAESAPPKVEQVSVAALFARAIEAIHDGTSVFELSQ
ncbi:MAG TPA: ribose-phosphate diphosphokinase [Polyangiaceae bacterium]|nr:ribose-phosphate diphosphokinase [Polyangiaceae bacterium]